MMNKKIINIYHRKWIINTRDKNEFIVVCNVVIDFSPLVWKKMKISKLEFKSNCIESIHFLFHANFVLFILHQRKKMFWKNRLHRKT